MWRDQAELSITTSYSFQMIFTLWTYQEACKLNLPFMNWNLCYRPICFKVNPNPSWCHSKMTPSRRGIWTRDHSHPNPLTTYTTPISLWRCPVSVSVPIESPWVDDVFGLISFIFCIRTHFLHVVSFSDLNNPFTPNAISQSVDILKT